MHQKRACTDGGREVFGGKRVPVKKFIAPAFRLICYSIGMWIRALPGFAPLLLSLAFLIAPFGHAAEHTVPAEFDQIRWNRLLEQLEPGDSITFESPTPHRVMIGRFVGSGGYGKIYQVADNPQQIIKIGLHYPIPGTASAVSNNIFFEEVAALRRLDSTTILHSKVISTFGSLAFIKEYVEGPTLSTFLSNWNRNPLETNYTVVNNVARLARDIQTQNLRFSDEHGSNIVVQNETLLPYFIETGSIAVYPAGVSGVDFYFEAFLTRAVQFLFARKAIWLALVQPSLLRPFLRIEKHARELKQNPTQASLDSLTREIQDFNRAELSPTEDALISNEMRRGQLDSAKRTVRDTSIDLLNKVQGLDLAPLRSTLCNASLTHAHDAHSR